LSIRYSSILVYQFILKLFSVLIICAIVATIYYYYYSVWVLIENHKNLLFSRILILKFILNRRMFTFIHSTSLISLISFKKFSYILLRDSSIMTHHSVWVWIENQKNLLFSEIHILKFIFKYKSVTYGDPTSLTTWCFWKLIAFVCIYCWQSKWK